MRFGVHIALAQCAPDAPVAHEHPEWLAGTYDDYFGAGRLCLGHAPCREWLTAQILRLIDEDGIDYLIQDGEDMVKWCDRTDHSHAAGDSNYAGSTLGIDLVIGAIRSQRPHVVLENCEDGGCMMTYKMARLYHTSITVDNIATYATRQGIYGASYPFSPRYSVRYMEDDPTPYTLRSSIFGGPLILMQRIGDWDERQMADTRAAIQQYKDLRTLVRDAKVVHLRPPRYNVERVGWGWDAIQALAPDQARSAVMVYRAAGDAPSRTIHPRGLLPDATYRVRLADSDATAERTGAAIMADGISVALPELAAEIISIDRV
jgi:alpha-galactosidase